MKKMKMTSCPKCGMEVTEDTVICPDYECRCIIPFYNEVLRHEAKKKKKKKGNKKTTD